MIEAVRADAPEVAGPPGVGPLGAVVDAVVAARRLAGWALWVELVGLAQLVAFWQGAPPIVDAGLHRYGEESPDPCAAADPDLADRLHHLVANWQLPRPVNMHELAEPFVTSELSAACGASRHAVGLRLDAARALFLDDRLPRSRQLLQVGLLDWTKLGTLVSQTRDLDDEVCRRVEARVIPDADLAAAAVDPLDVRADPAKPGATLPRITRVTNPQLERDLRAAIIAIDAETAAARAAAARRRRHVRATALDDAMARLEIEAGQEAVAAAMNDLDSAVASAKAAGDARTADQIRADHAIHLLTRGAFGRTAASTRSAESPESPGSAQTRDAAGSAQPSDAESCVSPESPDPTIPPESTRSAGPFGQASPAESAPDVSGTSQEPGRPSPCRCGSEQPATAALSVSLMMSLSTWLGLAEDPAVLDRYGPIPAALARQIAEEAVRDHPTTTTWRCVVTDDGSHRTVLGVGDPLRTPRHDPPPRLSRLVTTLHPRCTFPGCPVQARRCDLDHRVPYDGTDPASGGATCSCNVHPLCRTHHRLKGAGLITARPMSSGNGDVPLGTLAWSTAMGHTYRYDPMPPIPAPADAEDVALASAARRRRRALRDWSTSADPDLEERWDVGVPYDENWASEEWKRSLHEARRAATPPPPPAVTSVPVTPEEPPF